MTKFRLPVELSHWENEFGWDKTDISSSLSYPHADALLWFATCPHAQPIQTWKENGKWQKIIDKWLPVKQNYKEHFIHHENQKLLFKLLMFHTIFFAILPDIFKPFLNTYLEARNVSIVKPLMSEQQCSQYRKRLLSDFFLQPRQQP